MKDKKATYADSILAGVSEALEFSKGNLPYTTRKKVSITPIPKYDAKKIRDIRTSLRLTQITFADVLGVSVKTIEAWESGKNTPQGPASRFLQLLEINESLLSEHHIIY